MSWRRAANNSPTPAAPPPHVAFPPLRLTTTVSARAWRNSFSASSAVPSRLRRLCPLISTLVRTTTTASYASTLIKFARLCRLRNRRLPSCACPCRLTRCCRGCHCFCRHHLRHSPSLECWSTVHEMVSRVGAHDSRRLLPGARTPSHPRPRRTGQPLGLARKPSKSKSVGCDAPSYVGKRIR